MTDLASLVLEIDSTQVPKGTAALDNLTAAGTRAEVVTGKLGGTTTTAAAAATKMAREAQLAAHAATSFGNSANSARIVALEMTHVTRSLAEQLAMGVSPARAFASELGRISTAAQYSGGLGSLARTIASFLAPFAGIAALGGGVALAFLGIKSGAEAADPAAKNLIATLGLTRKEIEKLTDTTVTWGDVMGATFDVLAHQAGTSSEQVSSAWSEAMEFVENLSKDTIGALLAAFAALVQFVASAANDIGLAIGKGVAAGVNAALAAVEKLINGISEGINKIADGANSLMDRIPQGARHFLGLDGAVLGHVGTVSLGRVEAQGSFSNPLSDAAARGQATYDSVIHGFGAIGSGANARRDRRVRDQANQLIADRSPSGGGHAGGAGAHHAAAKAISEEQRAYDQALKSAQAFDANLVQETDRIGKNAIESKQMEVATAAAAARKAAAVAPTQAMKAALEAEAVAIEKDGAAWVARTKAQNAADFIKNTVEPIEQQVRLLGQSAEAQARANLEAEKAKIIADDGAAAWERYHAAQLKIIADQNKTPLQQWADQVPHTADQINTALQSIETRGFDNLASAIANVVTGTESLGKAFSDVARSIISDIVQMTIRMLIFRAISGIFGGGGGATQGFIGPPSANGNVFSGGNIIPFATGGVVSGPTVFPMSGGRAGLMGEAGPEAVMPLARDSRGRLGVRSSGNDNTAGPIEVHVIVDTSDDLLVKAAVVADSRIRAAAPRIIANARSATTRSLTRPRLP